jgi:hypothetical protein
MILYAAVSLLNYFFCDRAIIDKTLFFDIITSSILFICFGVHIQAYFRLKDFVNF